MRKWWKCWHAKRQQRLRKINKVLASHGCVATGFGPNSVGVQGDSRVHGPSVFITSPGSTEKAGEAATRLINDTPRHLRLTRVLMEIPTQES
jgi:hypothetical protein